MDRTSVDMGLTMQRVHGSLARSRRSGKIATPVAVTGVISVLALLGVLFGRLPRQDSTMFQRGYVLPAPEPMPSRTVSLPVVTVTLPAATPQVMLLPPPRRSLWEIRAELKRGLGEWEFPHYVNAPHYGSSPGSPVPSPIKPHLAPVHAE